MQVNDSIAAAAGLFAFNKAIESSELAVNILTQSAMPTDQSLASTSGTSEVAGETPPIDASGKGALVDIHV